MMRQLVPSLLTLPQAALDRLAEVSMKKGRAERIHSTSWPSSKLQTCLKPGYFHSLLPAMYEAAIIAPVRL